MGNFTSALGPLLQVGSTIGTMASAMQPYYENQLSNKQQKKSDALALKNAQANAAIQKESSRIENETAEIKRRKLLKRAVASQRASFGAQGIGSGAGSSEAVLLGLFDESDIERQQREKMKSIKDAAIDQSIGYSQAVNLLQQSQEQEKQALARLTDAF